MLVKMNNFNFRIYIKRYIICNMNEYHIIKNSQTKATLFQPAWLTADVIIAHWYNILFGLSKWETALNQNATCVVERPHEEF